VSDGALTAKTSTRLVVGDAVRVSFQPRRFPRCPAGFVADEGAPYSRLRGYGWRSVAGGARGFLRRQPPGLTVEASTGLAFAGPAEWVCDLPNGTYKVTLALGDPASPVGRRRVALEGKEAAAVDLAAQAAPVVLPDLRAAVADGQLSLQLDSPSGAPGAEISYILIQRE